MEATELLRLVFALVFTLALLGGFAWLLHRFSAKLPLLARNNPQARLGVIEWRPLDGRHQLFLIRRDQTEHLLVVSAQGGAQVIESGIPPKPHNPQGVA